MVKRYPGIEFVVRQGRLLAATSGIMLAMLALFGYFRTDSSLVLAAGLVCALIAYFVLRVGAELVEVIADTLLPK